MSLGEPLLESSLRFGAGGGGDSRQREAATPGFLEEIGLETFGGFRWDLHTEGVTGMILAVTETVDPTERVFIALGSNLGDRAANLTHAVERIAALPETHVLRISNYVETEPWGEVNQPSFLNAVAEINTNLEPETLLSELKRIETDLGRVPSYRWGPRLIDLDLLLYGERVLRTERLTLPHPGILERAFVFGPLGEIAPDVLEGLRRAAVPV